MNLNHNSELVVPTEVDDMQQILNFFSLNSYSCRTLHLKYIKNCQGNFLKSHTYLSKWCQYKDFTLRDVDKQGNTRTRNKEITKSVASNKRRKRKDLKHMHANRLITKKIYQLETKRGCCRTTELSLVSSRRHRHTRTNGLAGN
jgi:hypothetical protein